MSRLTYYDVTNIKVQFCPDDDPALSFYKLTIAAAGAKRCDEIVLFPASGEAAETLSRVFAIPAAKSMEPSDV